MTWFLIEEKKPSYFKRLTKLFNVLKNSRSNLSVITALTVELENMKTDLAHAKKTGELNRERAAEYKREGEALVQIRAHEQQHPEAAERHVDYRLEVACYSVLFCQSSKSFSPSPIQ